MEQIYKKIILRHYNNPSNKGVIKRPDKSFKGNNPSCGDKLEIMVKLDSRKKISEVAWDGEGCVISQSAASIFSEMITGKTLAQAQAINAEDFLKELDIALSPARRKCALLPLFTLSEGVDDEF